MYLLWIKSFSYIVIIPKKISNDCIMSNKYSMLIFFSIHYLLNVHIFAMCSLYLFNLSSSWTCFKMIFFFFSKSPGHLSCRVSHVLEFSLVVRFNWLFLEEISHRWYSVLFYQIPYEDMHRQLSYYWDANLVIW